MCFNDNDQKLWEEDPHEYVRKGYGEYVIWINILQDLGCINIAVGLVNGLVLQ